MALDHDAIDGDFFAGPDTKQVADMDMLQRNVLFMAALADPARGLGGEAEQCPDGLAGRGSGAQLEHLAKEDKRRDNGGSLEIDRD